MSGIPSRRAHRAATVFSALVVSVATVTSVVPAASAQSSFGGGTGAGGQAVTEKVVSPSTPAPSTPAPTNPAASPEATATPAAPSTGQDGRCLPVGFSAGWELATDTQANIDRTMTAVRAAGGSHYRFAIDWSYVEPSRGSYDWSRPDAVIRSAAAHGVQVVAILAYTPAWARAADGDRNSAQTRPADPAAYASFARAAAARYGQVATFELWNEPNLQQFFKPRPDAGQYAALVRAAYPAIKAVRPDATVLAGAMAAAGDDGVNIPGPRYTQQLYSAGAGGNFDGLSFHPYNYPERLDGTKWNTMAMADQIHATMSGRGDGAKKIWFTEFGAPAGKSAKATSEAEQGVIVGGGADIAASRDYVGGYLAYTLKDYGTSAFDAEQNFGILRNDFSPKAGYATAVAGLSRHRCG